MRAAQRSRPFHSPAQLRQRVRRTRHLAQRHAGTREEHRKLRVGLRRYVFSGELATLLTAPVIYSVFMPFVLLDAWVMLYQSICFRAWGVRRVRRLGYFAIDRHKLAYLNGIEKLNCLFCSYVNGLIAFVREVAARTEQYWCPIQHARRVRGAHDRYSAFVPYGDARAYREWLAFFRAGIRG